MDNTLFEIGSYKILKNIGSGGMGEVYLAYDPVCQRQVALKCIRSDIEINNKVREQFLNEAILTSQLTHPGIIPIYSIVSESDLIFFTMPFIEGKMLKELFAEARQKEMEGSLPDPSSSVAAFSYMFLQICSAVAYAHSRGIIHRDLKPSNILAGANHEVRILDWGLIKAVEDSEEQKKSFDVRDKISGTVIYLAPELTLGKPPSYQSEIYSLGLILYQMLTLRYPFHRSNMVQYAENMHKEVLIDPAKVAPHRDIPSVLSHIVFKCLAPLPENRYQTVKEIVDDLECYLESRSTWIKIADLYPENKGEWELYKNIPFLKFIDATLSLSKASFLGDIKLDVEVAMKPKGKGMGFVLNADEDGSGDCIWLSSDPQSATKLFRNQKLVMEYPDVILQRGEHYKICIEKVKNNLSVYWNNTLQLSSMNYLPQIGTRIGILEKGVSSIQHCNVFVEAKNLQGNHLATADTLLAYKEYDKALNEYRRVAQTFPETVEGREALFRAGIVLLEEMRSYKGAKKSKKKIASILQEFNRLHSTAGAPLEYLGHVLVYEWLHDTENEIKTFKYALQNFSHHPLIRVLGDQLIYRIHYFNQKNSPEFYSFALLAIRYLPFEMIQPLLSILNQKLKPIYFLDDIDVSTEKFQRITACVALGFYLNDPQTVADMIDEVSKVPPSHLQLVESALIALIELDASELAQQKLDALFQMLLDVQAVVHFGWIHQLICASQGNFENMISAFLAELPKKLEKQHMHFVLCLLNQAKKQKKINFMRNVMDYLQQFDLSAEQQQQINLNKKSSQN